MQWLSMALVLMGIASLATHHDVEAFVPPRQSSSLMRPALLSRMSATTNKKSTDGSDTPLNIASLVEDAASRASSMAPPHDDDITPDVTNHPPVVAVAEDDEVVISHDKNEIESSLHAPSTVASVIVMTEEEEIEAKFDKKQMRLALQMAQSAGGERGAVSPYPKPIGGAVIVTQDGRVLGKGRSDYRQDCIQAAIADAGLVATPLREWCVSWPSRRSLRDDLAQSTLYVTLEPSAERHGEVLPPMTQLILMSGIPRVVIGCADPIPEKATQGAATLHKAGIRVSMGVEQEDCQHLLEQYSELANSKLQVMARKHFERFGRPLGFLHCSVVDSHDVEAFARHGNAFGKDFGGKHLSFRDFGSYEIAPPPESVWADDVNGDNDDFETQVDTIFNMEFDEEEFEESLGNSPMMPWYEQVDAVVATFPKEGNGPSDDPSLSARLNGLKWLATIGEHLPANVERILVLDATDLRDLPMTNDHPSLPRGVNVEAFWKGDGRKPTRVLLRKGENAQAQAAALAAARAASAAAEAAKAAMEAVESGDAANAAEAALECQEAATAATGFILNEMEAGQALKRQLTQLGVLVEVLNGGEAIDVMKHLGKRNGYTSVVWRAGCWGSRGPKAILDGAFQWVSAHLAVDAVGGKFWQLMLAERAIQAACGPERKVKIFADQEDISLEYCDEIEADEDCVLTVDGRPVRHVRLDCRIALVDDSRPREFVLAKTEKLNRRHIEQEAPWFL